jgi:hypothetical protein
MPLPRTGEDCDPNQPTCRREFWRLQVAASGFVRATNRLGTELPCLLRDDRQGLCVLLCGGEKRKQSADIERALLLNIVLIRHAAVHCYEVRGRSYPRNEALKQPILCPMNLRHPNNGVNP